jgi:pimeloyl-ACP methyl ester carboxylesterase
VAFVVSLAGPAIPEARNAVLQAARTVKAMGRSDQDAGEIAALTQKAVDAAVASPNFETFHAQLGPLGAEAIKKGLVTPAQVSTVDSFWWWDNIRIDRSTSWSKVHVPVLAMYGTLDVQVPADENAPAAKAALKDDADATVVVLPRLNHFFQTANTGAPSEYGPIEETVASAALATIIDWLSAHVKSGTDGAKIKP